MIEDETEEKVQITKAQYDQYMLLRKIFLHANADKYQGVYFICGEAGEKDDFGLPSNLLVCPAMGLDGFAMYKKEKDYSAPGW